MRKYTPEQAITSFWNKVAITSDDDKCWLWLGYCNKDGYGHVKYKGAVIATHRIAWTYPDYIVPEGMEIRHSCDRPACCNPKHLWLGTKQDNMDDKVARNRQHHPKGEKNGRAKLTTEKVSEIRDRYKSGGVFMRQLGREFGVALSTIRAIIIQKNWKE